MMQTSLILKLMIIIPAASLGFPKITHFDLNQLESRSVIVHLFEWKFSDIGLECERFLGPQGYGAVQLSPANEHLFVQGHPFWERYEPISYIIQTRSGTADDFRNMSRRCNDNGVRIYADVVLNHMTALNPKPIIGSAGSSADPKKFSYPSVPYNVKHFNEPCDISDWSNATLIRNCQVTKGSRRSRDLNQTQEHVRNKIVDYMNELISLGVSGFRIDSAKHMWPSDLETIFSRLNNLNIDYGFQKHSRPFIYHDLKDSGTDTDTMGRWEYTHLGMITEFAVPGELGRAFRGKIKLKFLRNFGPQWNFLPSKCAIVFVDDHELQRGLGFGSGPDTLTNKDGKRYRMAVAFLLAHPYGTARLISSYNFRQIEDGPPWNTFEEIESPIKDGKCQHGWVCEHRWNSIANMVGFRNQVYGSSYSNWWDNSGKQMAFSRGGKGFIVWNLDDYDLYENMQTCLPTGTYCDVISGSINQNHCTGTKVEVDEDGMAQIFLASDDANGVIALHIGAVLGYVCSNPAFEKVISMYWKTDCFKYNWSYVEHAVHIPDLQ